jgi:hypothetical protein
MASSNGCEDSRDWLTKSDDISSVDASRATSRTASCSFPLAHVARNTRHALASLAIYIGTYRI